MSVSKTLFGTTTNVPETDETGWGAEMTNWVEAVNDGLDAKVAIVGTTQYVAKEGSTASTLAGSATLTRTHERHVVSGSGGAVTLSATTAIANGSTTGEILTLEGGSDANTVTVLHGANTQQNGDITLSQYDQIKYRWNGTDWIEIERNT